MKKIIPALFKYAALYVFIVPVSAMAAMFLLRLSGFIGYYARSGPGIYDGNPVGGFFTPLDVDHAGAIRTTADALREADYLLHWFGITIPAAVLIAVFLFLLVHLLKMFGTPQRKVTTIAVVLSTIASTYLVFSFGWYVLMDHAVVALAVVTGCLYGALLSRYHTEIFRLPPGSVTPRERN